MAKSAQMPLASWLPNSMEGLKYINIIFTLFILIALFNTIYFLLFWRSI
jgi:hypothetical protein